MKDNMKNHFIGKIFTFVYDQAGCQDKKERLDLFLASQLSDHSRSSIKNLLQDRCVEVNGKVVRKAGAYLHQGDTIVVSIPKVSLDVSKAQKLDLDIIDLQDDFLVINKPAGLLVHNSQTNKDEVSLVNGLLYQFKEFEQFNDQQRPGIVHRLDKQTSGLIIVARNSQAMRELSALFKNRDIHKTYLAVVKGHPDKAGTVDFDIGRHRTQRHKMSHVSFNGRDAVTHYQVLAYYDDASLVAARPITGRTHQIRVHCAAIGHGILGDEVYGTRFDGMNRQALHAWKLSFVYKGKKYEYCARVPDDFKHLIVKLNKKKVEY
jgi:23S rRNA pseudouridine1911/1915/1917 synthase